MSKRSRAFTVTIFTEPEPTFDEEWMRYFCYQKEIAPTTGRAHWQSYVYLRNGQTFKAFLNSMPESWGKAHAEVSKGTPQDNKNYCSKPTTGVPDTFREFGSFPQQGRRIDWEKACREVKEGGLPAVTDDAMIVKFHRGLSVLASVRASQIPHVYRRPTVIWTWGPTGTMKTKSAYDHDPCLYHQTSSDGWFDGYYNQKTVLIDDYDYGAFPIREFLQMTDGYRYQVKVKGSMVPLKADHIFITSHYEPKYYFPEDRHTEVLRRISKIIHTGPKAESVLPPPLLCNFFGKNKKTSQEITKGTDGLHSEEESTEASLWDSQGPPT